MGILHYSNYTAYEFNDSFSEKLIIYFDGSRYDSTLGRYNTKKWRPVSFASQFVPILREKYTILIPEKLNRTPGGKFFYDMEDRANYTADNLLKCYSTIINSYLEEHKYSSVILIGISEGALLLPVIYENIINKDIVKSMVSIMGGGLSLYEDMEILSVSSSTPRNWKKGYLEMIKLYNENDSKYPDSITEGFNNMTFRWYNSFMHIRPYDYYKNINIPILFVNGNKDYLIPIESTKHIEENLPQKPFEYLYYKNIGHGPGTYYQTIQFREDITKWIINKKL
jgi:esterase/lipase